MNRQILEEATAWFVDFRTDSGDAQVKRAFMQWLRLSPEHIRAYMDIAQVYARLPAPEGVTESDIERLIHGTRSRVHSQDKIVRIDASSVQEGRARREGTKGLRHWRLVAGIAVVGIAIAVLAALALMRNPVYSTQIGEQRSITLEDGSRIELNARSKVKVRLSDTERYVELLEGQALFDVAKDAQRPFIVRSAHTLVRAVGTRFDIDRKASGTTVTVLEGKVEVRSVASAHEAESGRGKEYLLSTGEQTVVTPEAIARPRRANISSVTAWTHQQLEFDETPLADVVEELNRHNTRPLVIVSPVLEGFRVTGVYSSRDPASLVRFLRTQPGVQVTENDAEIHIAQQ